MSYIENRIPNIYNQLLSIFPKKPWVKAVDDIDQLGRQFIGRGGQEEIENSVAFGLTLWERHNYLVASSYMWATVLEAMMFCERLVRLFDAVRKGQTGPSDLGRRFEGALKNAADMRALRFEIYIAEVMATRNCQVFWPDETKGKETYDLLVRPLAGLPEFELECKSFAGDKGAAVKLADGHRLIGACISNTPNICDLFPSHPNQATILTIDLSSTIPKKIEELNGLAVEIITRVKSNDTNQNGEIFSIRYDFCPIVGNLDDPDSCFDAAAKLPGAMLAFNASGCRKTGWKGIRVVWSGDFNLWKEVEKVAKQAADKQLTGSKPGALAMQFINDTAESINNVNQVDNKFRLLAEKLFSREHVAAIAIASDFSIRPAQAKINLWPEMFMHEFCKFAAFDSDRGSFPNSRLKRLFA